MAGRTPFALTMARGNGAALIAPDMRADLLLVDGNPTQDIANVADRVNHRLVMKDGATVGA